MVTTARLQLETHATSGASGTVTLRFGNVPPHAVWHVDQLSISLSKGTGKVVVSHGPTIAAPIDIDNTHLSQANQTSPQNWDMLPGESCTITFLLLQPNTICSATLRASQELWQP